MGGTQSNALFLTVAPDILLQLDADWWHFWRPLAVAATPVDDLSVEPTYGVPVLAVISGDSPSLVLLPVFQDRKGQRSLRLTVRHVVPVGYAGGGGAVGAVGYRLSRQHCEIKTLHWQLFGRLTKKLHILV